VLVPLLWVNVDLSSVVKHFIDIMLNIYCTTNSNQTLS
jgi:hypothetical protein